MIRLIEREAAMPTPHTDYQQQIQRIAIVGALLQRVEERTKEVEDKTRMAYDEARQVQAQCRDQPLAQAYAMSSKRQCWS